MDQTEGHSVRRWQQLGGWFNWALNIFPLFWLALNNVYPKLRNQTNKNRTMWVNNAVRDDLLWALEKILASDGRYHLTDVTWLLSAATYTILCDACPLGMRFWYPALDEG